MGSSKSLRKRNLVVRAGSADYPQIFYVEFLKDGVDELNGLVVGAPVSVDCWLNGRIWNNPTTGEAKNFITLKAAGPVVGAAPAAGQPVAAGAPAASGYFN